MKFIDGDLGDTIVWVDSSDAANKSMVFGNKYQIVGLEFPAPHFRGRFIVVCEDGEVKAFYPKRFRKEQFKCPIK